MAVAEAGITCRLQGNVCRDELMRCVSVFQDIKQQDWDQRSMFKIRHLKEVLFLQNSTQKEEEQ